MRDAGIRPDENEAIAFFEVGVGVGRRVEAEAFFVGGDRGRHALPRVAVAVNHAEAELGDGPQKRHLLGRDLPGREEGDRFIAVTFLNVADAARHRAERGVPIDCRSLALFILQQRRCASLRRIEDGERFPAFGAGHAQVDGVILRRRQSDGFVILQQDVQPAACRAKTADGSRRRIGNGGDRQLTKTEAIRRANELASQRPILRPQQRTRAIRQR